MDSYLRMLCWALLVGILINSGKQTLKGIPTTRRYSPPPAVQPSSDVFYMGSGGWGGTPAVRGYGKPSEMDSSDYASDDYQNDDDDSNDEDNTPPASILSGPLTLTVNEGDDVLLPCETVNGDAYTTMWMNGSQTLFIDAHQMYGGSRLMTFSNRSIIIHDANLYDSGVYVCQLSTNPVMEVKHVVNVLSGAKITRMQPHVPSGQSKIMRKGESLTLSCEVKGYPVPTVTWTRRGRKHFPNGHERMTGTSITFEEVNRKYSGIYECEASNEYGRDKKSVEIHVHYQPEIEIEEETVTTALGFQPEITCTVHAEPKAEVKWYKNGDVVKKSSRVSATEIGNKHTLTISNVSEHDFGSYTCHAANELGRNKKSIVLSGAPTKPKVKLNVAEDGKSQEVEWSVESYVQVTEVEVQYKKMEDERWTTMASTTTHKRDQHTYHGKEMIKHLPPGNYVVRVRAKNLHGWSHHSTEEIFNGDFLVDEALSAAAEVAKSTSGAEVLRPLTFATVLILSISKFFI